MYGKPTKKKRNYLTAWVSFCMIVFILIGLLANNIFWVVLSVSLWIFTVASLFIGYENYKKNPNYWDD